MDEIELENQDDKLSTIFGVLEQLSAIDLETRRDGLLAIFDELAVGLEARCELYGVEMLGDFV